MRLMSPILRRVVYPALGRVGYFHSRPAASVSVVTYHGVLPPQYRSVDPFLDGTLVSSATFRSHLRLLKKHYNVISPEQFLGWLQGSTLPPHAVLLTCDDGLLNNVTTMLAFLREEGLRCLFFVTGASAGTSPGTLWYADLYLMLTGAQGSQQPFEWRGVSIPGIAAGLEERRTVWAGLIKVLSGFDAGGRNDFLLEAGRRWGLDSNWKARYLESPGQRQRFQLLGAAELKQLTDAGMTIGAHTMTHPVLSAQAAELARAEIANCRLALEECTRQPVWAFAYPFGDPSSVGSREFHLAEAAGYACAFVNVGGSVGPVQSGFSQPGFTQSKFSQSRFSLPRIHVTPAMSLPVYEAHVSGFHGLLQQRFRGAISAFEQKEIA